MTDTKDTKLNIAQTVAALTAKPEIHGRTDASRPYMLAPSSNSLGNMQWTAQSLDCYAEPRRKDTRTFSDANSLIAYVNRFKTPQTQIFAEKENGKVSAIIDYLGESKDAETAKKGATFEHVANLLCKTSEEFEGWSKIARKYIPQSAFAEFLDEHYAEVSEPPGVELREIALTLETEIGSSFKSATRMRDGTGAQSWSVNMTTKAGATGQLEVPEKITLRIPLFEGGTYLDLDARLRIRVTDGEASFIILPNKWQEVRRIAFADLCEEIQVKTQVALYFVA
jgi:uncharacterized protein YfdQ (DUF2303 family)